MAKPRIFISSTYYDLKHIRASLDLFVDSLGYEPVLSEKGDIAYTPDRALDASCYREAENADVFVLIIGGRYGAEAGGGDKDSQRGFFDRYESITKKEYESAASRDIPAYILIEKGVYSEYQTFLRNKERQDVVYAHVESVNVFLLIEDILSRPRNNPVQTFEKFEEIEKWLREQWAGLFRELLRRQSQQQQLVGLTTQVAELRDVNDTLKKYMEAVMKGADRAETSELIKKEAKREEIRRQERLRENTFVTYIMKISNLDFDAVAKAMEECSDGTDFSIRISKKSKEKSLDERILRTLRNSAMAKRDFNEARSIIGVRPVDFENTESEDIRTGRIHRASGLQSRSELVVDTKDIIPKQRDREDVLNSAKKSSTKERRPKTLTKKTLKKK